MDWNANVRLLAMKRKSKAMLEKMRNSAIERLQSPESESEKKRARAELNQITRELTRHNDDIYTLEKELGIGPFDGSRTG